MAAVDFSHRITTKPSEIKEILYPFFLALISIRSWSREEGQIKMYYFIHWAEILHKNCAYVSEYHHGFSTVDITAKSSRCYANFASSQRLCNASMGIIVIHFFTPPPHSPQMKRGEGKYLHSPRAINGYTQKSPGKSPHWDSEMDPPYFAYVRCVSSGSF